MNLPEITRLGVADAQDRHQALGMLFEPCSALNNLVDLILSTSVFTAYGQLIEATRTKLHELAQDLNDPRIPMIVAAHPRLGATRPETLSSLSQAEQASLAQASLTQGTEADDLARYNAEYEKTFPGLRYVVFVNGRSRRAVMDDMDARIKRNDYGSEVKEAFNAMCDIAQDRLKKMDAVS